MCSGCEGRPLGRRGFLAMASFGALAGSMALASNRAWAAPTGTRTALNPDQALAALKEGNIRYVSSPEACALDLGKRRAGVAPAQAPWATIVSCSDSRVPPELLFGGLGLGELFVARNAGNMVDTATMGTIEYGAAALGVPLIVILGHQRCGAVAAACDVATNKTTFPGSIGPMVQPIVPAAQAVAGKPGDFLDNAIRESARLTAVKVATESPIVAPLVKDGKVKVVAARYDLDDGRVAFFV